MTDFIKNLFDSFKDRIRNPFTGAFAISWIFVNWRLIAILFFSNQTIVDRINLIESDYSHWHYTLLLPISFALFYVVIFPWIMRFLDLLSTKIMRLRKSDVIYEKARDIELQEQIIKAENKIEKKKIELRENKDENDRLEIIQAQNENLSQTNETLKKQLMDNTKMIERLTNSLSVYDKDILKDSESEKQMGNWSEQWRKINNHKKIQKLLELIVESNNKKERKLTLNDDDVAKLSELELIYIKLGSHRDEDMYFLTEKGKYFLNKYMQLDIEMLNRM